MDISEHIRNNLTMYESFNTFVILLLLYVFNTGAGFYSCLYSSSRNVNLLLALNVEHLVFIVITKIK